MIRMDIHNIIMTDTFSMRMLTKLHISLLMMFFCCWVRMLLLRLVVNTSHIAANEEICFRAEFEGHCKGKTCWYNCLR